MLRARILTASKTAVRGARFNSTAAKTPAAASGVVSSVSNAVSQTVFWAKVVGELGKQVYIKEGMAPPTGAQFQAVFQTLKTQGSKVMKSPKQYLDQFQANTMEHSIRFLVGAVQVVGIFSLGEMIGRRHIVGYKHHH